MIDSVSSSLFLPFCSFIDFFSSRLRFEGKMILSCLFFTSLLFKDDFVRSWFHSISIVFDGSCHDDDDDGIEINKTRKELILNIFTVLVKNTFPQESHVSDAWLCLVFKNDGNKRDLSLSIDLVGNVMTRKERRRESFFFKSRESDIRGKICDLKRKTSHVSHDDNEIRIDDQFTLLSPLSIFFPFKASFSCSLSFPLFLSLILIEMIVRDDAVKCVRRREARRFQGERDEAWGKECVWHKKEDEKQSIQSWLPN